MGKNENTDETEIQQKTTGDVIIREVIVDRTQSPQEMLPTCGRKQRTDRNAVGTMPQGIGKVVEIHFFRENRKISDNDLEKAYEMRALDPVDPASLITFNKADPNFSKDYPNVTHWKEKGTWYYISFSHWVDRESYVYVFPKEVEYDDDQWFAGMPKQES